MDISSKHKRILTGDRPTGRMHIGHYFGSLQNRARLQNEYETFILIANIQALADNTDNPGKVADSIKELVMDYYASGLDFTKSTVYIQSNSPEVNEIFVYLANFVTVQQIQQNPTIKQEFASKGFVESIPFGFFMHPVHQVADILMLNADLVPVGHDQAPMVEMSADVADKFNSTYKCDIFNHPKPLYGVERNVPGFDGNVKMGKSLGNAINLSDTSEELLSKIKRTKTDHERLSRDAPGKPENSVVFAYLDLLSTIQGNISVSELEDLKSQYRAGTITDSATKDILFKYMDSFLMPIRSRRIEAEGKLDELMGIVHEGNRKVSLIAQELLAQMKEVMKIRF